MSMTSFHARFAGPVIDCDEDAVAMARFYASVLGWRIADQGPLGKWAIIRSPGDPPLKIEFAGSAEYRRPVWPNAEGEQQMMMHLDVEVDDIESAVATVIEAGGAEAPWQPPNRDRSRLRIVLDPAGHPLCLFLRGE
jgi:predicted enzyme related to lactoylglutathione lyase